MGRSSVAHLQHSHLHTFDPRTSATPCRCALCPSSGCFQPGAASVLPCFGLCSIHVATVAATFARDPVRTAWRVDFLFGRFVLDAATTNASTPFFFHFLGLFRMSTVVGLEVLSMFVVSDSRQARSPFGRVAIAVPTTPNWERWPPPAYQPQQHGHSDNFAPTFPTPAVVASHETPTRV